MFIPFIVMQCWYTVAPGGIIERYGFWEGFPKFVEISLQDPLLATGLIDFAVVALIAFIWLLHDLPANIRRHPRTIVWVASYLVFPGLGFFLYFLWLNPDHRLVS